MGKRKDGLSWFFIAFILMLVGFAAFLVLLPNLRPHTSLRIGDGVFTAHVVTTNEDKEKGLAGTANLAKDKALILVYTRDGKWPIWMKDMKYPIDAVWLDKDKKVVFIVKNISPDTYPDQSYTPKENARYIIEFAAGTVDSRAIKTSSVAVFDENNLQGIKL